MSFTNEEMNYALEEAVEMKSQFQGWGCGEKKESVLRGREFLQSSAFLPSHPKGRRGAPVGTGVGCSNQQAG